MGDERRIATRKEKGVIAGRAAAASEALKLHGIQHDLAAIARKGFGFRILGNSVKLGPCIETLFAMWPDVADVSVDELLGGGRILYVNFGQDEEQFSA